MTTAPFGKTEGNDEEVEMGIADDIKGKSKELQGTLTGDRSKETAGKVDQARGDVKDAASSAKDAVSDLADRGKEKLRDAYDDGADSESAPR